MHTSGRGFIAARAGRDERRWWSSAPRYLEAIRSEPGRDVAGRLGSRGRPSTGMSQADRTPRGRGPKGFRTPRERDRDVSQRDLHHLIGPRGNRVGRPRIGWEWRWGLDMAQAKEMAKTGKRMGKKVLATDTAQDVVGVVVDGLEEVAVDKADDVAENVKARAARAGGRSPKRPSAKKSSSRQSTAKKSPRQEVHGQAEERCEEVHGQAEERSKKSTAKRTGARSRRRLESPRPSGRVRRSPRPSGKVPRSPRPDKKSNAKRR